MADTRPVATAYWIVGDGPEVVFVHGLGEDHRSWAVQQSALAQEYRTCAYDIRGHGKTPIGDAAGTLEQLGSDLVGLLETWGRRPRTLVGFSLGGTIVLWVAARRPDLANGVVALGTSSVVGGRAASGYRERIALVRSGDRNAFAEVFRQDRIAGLHRDDVDVDALVRWHLEAVGEGSGYCNAAEAMAALNSSPLTPLLSSIKCPVLIVGGEHDRLCPPKAQQILLEGLPQARYEELKGVGHLMNIEDPAAVTAVVRRFLRELTT